MDCYKPFISPLCRSYKTCVYLLCGETFCNIMLSIHSCLYSFQFEVLLSFGGFICKIKKMHFDAQKVLLTVFRSKGSINLINKRQWRPHPVLSTLLHKACSLCPLSMSAIFHPISSCNCYISCAYVERAAPSLEYVCWCACVWRCEAGGIVCVCVCG